MAALLAWYTKKLYSDPIRTKIFTSMLVNPIGAMIAPIVAMVAVMVVAAMAGIVRDG